MHVSLAERVGNPLAMQAALVGNQHGVSFFREVGIGAIGDEENEDHALVLEGSQVGSIMYHGVTGDVGERISKTKASLSPKPSTRT